MYKSLLHRCAGSAMTLVVVLMGTSATFADMPSVNGDPTETADGREYFRVQGEFRSSADSARESALRNFQDKLRVWLAKKEPPIHHVPDVESIRRDMKAKVVSVQEEQILDSQERMYKMTMEFELLPDQVRALRERDRVAIGLWLLGGSMAIIGFFAIVLRLHGRNRQYQIRAS